MTDIDVNTAEFEREERYIVVKRKHLTREREKTLRLSLVGSGIPTIECVVVESDWPEYETVWSMIEARVTGKPQATAEQAAEIADLRDFMLEARTGLVVLQNLLVSVGLDAGVRRAGEMLDRIDALAREGKG